MAEEEKVAEFDKEGLRNVLLVAVSVCLVCSIFVSSAAVLLKPRQQINQELDRKQNILRAAGMLSADGLTDSEGRGVAELFEQFRVRAVTLETGEYTDVVDVESYDQAKASRVNDTSRDLETTEDIATLGRREHVGLVYLLETEQGTLDTIVLPVRGYGLWGTLFGYLAIEGNLHTIAGLGFYAHKETPGLGGEVDNPGWKAMWPGVLLFDESGAPAVRLVKTRSPEGSAAAAHEVDALSGATMTSRGVENLVRFWTGELGYGPFLNKLQAGA
ncbi:MAG: Na(+)-translocating NADH-quinone reductase subunit C [Gammaproteobacteria bacterium]|nr:Na(+)-translocating NADH-quinone reductase subunit C [Gammaproteobacteria bacterium]